MSYDALIATALARPQHNIHGDLGPRCPTCSGLGSFLVLGSAGSVTKYASRCRCQGSGIDFEAVERADRDLLWRQVHEIERRLGLPETSRYNYPTIKASRQYWMECIAWATTDGAAVASSVTETILFPSVMIPSNYMQDGRALKLFANGKYTTLGTGTVSHIYRLRWGALPGSAGTLLAASALVSLVASTANGYFEIALEIQTRSNGQTGTLIANGHSKTFGSVAPTVAAATGAPAVSPMTIASGVAPAALTCDLAQDTPLVLTIQHGASSSSNTATGLQYTLDSKN